LLIHLAGLVEGTDRRVLEALAGQLLDAGLEHTVRAVLERRTPGAVAALVSAARADTGHGPWAAERELVRQLAEEYPGDPGIVVAALLNLMSLQEGEALFLPAGNIHAYLSGFGVEVMASSDNVLRGGLTPKHVDVPELLAVLEFEPVPVPFVEPVVRPEGGLVYPVPVADFELVKVDRGTAGDLARGRAAVIVVTAGTARVEQGPDTVVLERGAAVFVSPGPEPVTVSADGTVFVAAG
jgi:mannose-6-phosphate isomerase